jgi:hypothetical protein
MASAIAFSKVVYYKPMLIWAVLIFFSLFLLSCKEEKEDPPQIINIKLTEPETLVIAYERADFSAKLISDGPLYSHLRDRGFCWSPDSVPTLSNLSKSLGFATKPGSFSGRIEGLNPESKYFIRAYAIYKSEVIYSDIISFTTLPFEPPLVNTDEIAGIYSEKARVKISVVKNGGKPLTALGVCWSTSPNPTLSDSHTSDSIHYQSSVSTITGLIPATKYFVRAYASSAIGTTYGNELNFTTEDFFECGNIFTRTHVAGDIAPETKTIDYNTILSNVTGSPKCWIIQNLGAEHPASSFTDTSSASAGWYWQFNRKQGYKVEGLQRTPNTIWTRSICEHTDWTPSNDPCTQLLRNGWRMPTQTEIKSIFSHKGWNYNTTNQFEEFKFHCAGILDMDTGELILFGTYSSIWSTTTSSPEWAFMSVLGTDIWGLISDGRKTVGRSIRCLQD